MAFRSWLCFTAWTNQANLARCHRIQEWAAQLLGPTGAGPRRRVNRVQGQHARGARNADTFTASYAAVGSRVGGDSLYDPQLVQPRGIRGCRGGGNSGTSQGGGRKGCAV